MLIFHCTKVQKKANEYVLEFYPIGYSIHKSGQSHHAKAFRSTLSPYKISRMTASMIQWLTDFLLMAELCSVTPHPYVSDSNLHQIRGDHPQKWKGMPLYLLAQRLQDHTAKNVGLASSKTSASVSNQTHGDCLMPYKHLLGRHNRIMLSPNS